MIDPETLASIREKMLNRLPILFNTNTTSMFYKLITAISGELSDGSLQLEDLKKQTHVSTATGTSLDRFGEDFATSRISGESDGQYRKKIMATYSKGRLTKPALKELLYSIGLTNFGIEEHNYDQWFMSTYGDIFENTTEEDVVSIDSTHLEVHYSILANTKPSIWLKIDKNYDNYGQYITDINDNKITISKPLPAENVELVVRYVPYTTDLPRLKHSFMHRDTIARTTHFIDSAEVISSDDDNIIIRDIDHIPTPAIEFNESSMFADRYNRTSKDWSGNVEYVYGVSQSEVAKIYHSVPNKRRTVIDFAYLDRDNGVLYEWSDVINAKGEVEITESNRIGNEVNGERTTSTDMLTVNVDFPISKVVGVYLKSDYNKVGNYATDNNFNYKTITLNRSLPYNNTEVVVDYLKYPILNYSNSINIPLLNISGYDDAKYTVELLISPHFKKWGTFKYNSGIKYGQFQEVGVNQLMELLEGIKAAGVRVKVAIVKFGAVYGLSYYGQDYYGSSPYWKIW